jgi:hypothetical protein
MYRIMVDTSNETETEKETEISREQHENRNELNELPVGKLKPKEEGSMEYVDDEGRLWRRNPDTAAAYHQRTGAVVSFPQGIRQQHFLWFLEVPNLKFNSQNADKSYSEIVANRYTGELIVDC